MPQFVLEILDGDRAGEVVTLTERPLRIGRKPQNDLVIPDEKASGVHAEVVFEGDRHVLRDLGSTNGTLMDGRKVTEVVLGSGDTFAIGRVRMRFRGEGEEVAAAGGDVQMARIDAARLQAAKSRSRPVGLMVIALVAVAGAGGYLWWQGSGGDGGTRRAAAGPRPVLNVPGNRLADLAGCETAEGWDLQVAGAAFVLGADAHTGRGGFEVVRGSDDAPDFAVAATAVEQRVLAGRTLIAAAHLRTLEGGRAAVRLSFWSGSEAIPFRYRTGSALQEHDGWQRVQVSAAVPAQADHCRVEVVAALPKAGSAVQLDDVALGEEASGTGPIERKVGDSGTVLGTGASVVIRSMDPDDPATLLAMLPGDAAPEYQGLLAAGQLVLSDVGASVGVDADDAAAVVQVTGCDRVQLLFPADSAGGLLVRPAADQPDGAVGFAGGEANARFEARAVLLGGRSTRCLLAPAVDSPAEEAAVAFDGSTQGGIYRLVAAAPSLRFTLNFRQERQQARELLRTAEELERRGEPGQALDTLRQLLQTVPHDYETMNLALARRAEWQEQLASRLRKLEVDLDEAMFFDTRGGFERTVSELDALVALYGEQNLEDPAAVAATRQKAADRLAELDQRRAAQQRQRLETMAGAFESVDESGLAQLVREYVKEHFASDGEEGQGGK